MISQLGLCGTWSETPKTVFWRRGSYESGCKGVCITWTCYSCTPDDKIQVHPKVLVRVRNTGLTLMFWPWCSDPVLNLVVWTSRNMVANARHKSTINDFKTKWRMWMCGVSEGKIVIYSSFCTKKTCKKKNLSLVRGMNRQICPSGHCLASLGRVSIHTSHSWQILISWWNAYLSLS